MSNERLSFFVVAVQAVRDGWRLEGEPGYDSRHWARPGDVFDHVLREDGSDELEVNLVVVEPSSLHAVVAGVGGNQLKSGDLLSGER
ncbi:hypothetical protein [Actinoplanes sp. DH11]|uniref:hypothetical protein n=1 Tax=Actinoplanes sp. DH11 TaxID=2857011 RepID=UPI001E453916|nr:hypothetical protein [Actinoplanes sp. DH11]